MDRTSRAELLQESLERVRPSPTDATCEVKSNLIGLVLVLPREGQLPQRCRLSQQEPMDLREPRLVSPVTVAVQDSVEQQLAEVVSN
jgi:hypothetical protein